MYLFIRNQQKIDFMCLYFHSKVSFVFVTSYGFRYRVTSNPKRLYNHPLVCQNFGLVIDVSSYLFFLLLIMIQGNLLEA